MFKSGDGVFVNDMSSHYQSVSAAALPAPPMTRRSASAPPSGNVAANAGKMISVTSKVTNRPRLVSQPNWTRNGIDENDRHAKAAVVVRAAMTIGGAAWQSTSASARLTDGKLTIKASNNDLSDGAMKRQELHLLVTEFDGAGDYETAMSGSRFLTVGFDTETAKQADGDDAAAQNAILSALNGATHMTLAGAKVKVTSSDDTEIVGTFSWQPPEGSKQPAIEGGTFRAKVK